MKPTPIPRRPPAPTALCALIAFTTVVCLPGAWIAAPAAAQQGTTGQIDRESFGDDALFHRVDRNGDGVVTPDELPNPRLFERLDLDGDGVITLEEYRRAAALLASLRGGFNPRPDPQPDRTAPSGADSSDSADSASATPEAPATPAAPPEPTRGPEPLRAVDAGIGRMIDDLEFTTLAGQAMRLSQVMGPRGVVIAMTSATCPLSRRYLPSLAALESELRAQDVQLLLVNPFGSEDHGAIREQLEPHALQAPYVHDRNQHLSRALGAATSTEVFLLDARRTLVYRGALDDQYGIDHSHDQPRRPFLRDAVEAMIGGRAPRLAATTAPGCELDFGSPPDGEAAADPAVDPAAAVTYHRDIARIVQQHCVSCHRTEGIAPFPLETLEQVTERAGVIRRVVREQTMPPWFAAPPHDGGASPWGNDRSLPERDQHDLLAWLNSPDRPAGDPADAPLPLVFPADGWSIGEPDRVFGFAEPVPVRASGTMPYVYVTVDTDIDEDRWVRAVEIQPGAPEVVHHVLVFALPPAPEGGRNARRRAAAGVGVDYWAGYVPGNSYRIYDDGYARRLPRGARLVFQMHYTPNGTATEDVTRIGLVFADQPPRHEVRTASVRDARFRIPPGAPRHEVRATLPVPADVKVLGYMPHHHLRAVASRYELIHPGGGRELLLDVPRYDFNWQLFYQYQKPRPVAAGSRVEFTAWYDNSPANPANPDPAQTVRWGDQTHDEMHLGYIEYVLAAE